jgi:hypothetical protein
MKLLDGSCQIVTKVKGLRPETNAPKELTVFKNWKTEWCCARWRGRESRLQGEGVSINT